MTPDPEIQLDRDVIAAATPGPWYADDGAMCGFEGSWDVCGPEFSGLASMSDGGIVAKRPAAQLEANAVFIARARTRYPALLDANAALQAEVERLRKVIEAAADEIAEWHNSTSANVGPIAALRRAATEHVEHP